MYWDIESERSMEYVGEINLRFAQLGILTGDECNERIVNDRVRGRPGPVPRVPGALGHGEAELLEPLVRHLGDRGDGVTVHTVLILRHVPTGEELKVGILHCGGVVQYECLPPNAVLSIVISSFL